MPKLWSETVETHRRDVRAAILDITAALVTEHGLAAVTMSQIAERTGIGRATLYKYFPDIESILIAWHEEMVANHLEQLGRVRDQAPGEQRLPAVLHAYAAMHHHRPQHTELAALVHRGEGLAHAHQQLTDFIGDLIVEAAQAGDVRGDVPTRELAAYCLGALQAAGAAVDQSAVQRLVALTLSGLRSRP